MVSSQNIKYLQGYLLKTISSINFTMMNKSQNRIRSCQTVTMEKIQKEPFVGVPEHSCSNKFNNKASLPKSLFLYRCFSVNFETFLRVPFQRITLGDCLERWQKVCSCRFLKVYRLILCTEIYWVTEMKKQYKDMILRLLTS